jgi:hypothetical protein
MAPSGVVRLNGSAHWARHLFWVTLGAFAALGILTGIGGNGWLVLVAVAVGAVIALVRGGAHGALGMAPGFLLGVAVLALLAPLWIEPCPAEAVACSVGPAYDVVPTVLGAAVTGVVVLLAMVLLEGRKRTQTN